MTCSRVGAGISLFAPAALVCPKPSTRGPPALARSLLTTRPEQKRAPASSWLLQRTISGTGDAGAARRCCFARRSGEPASSGGSLAHRPTVVLVDLQCVAAAARQKRPPRRAACAGSRRRPGSSLQLWPERPHPTVDRSTGPPTRAAARAGAGSPRPHAASGLPAQARDRDRRPRQTVPGSESASRGQPPGASLPPAAGYREHVAVYQPPSGPKLVTTKLVA